MTEPRSIDLAVEVPGTPEEVWETIATGPGIGSWFVPHQVDGVVGGKVRADFGEFGSGDAVVEAWEPPHRFVYTSAGERSLAFEFLVEARSGDTCVVRLVTSGFGEGEGWDEEYDGLSGGWPIFLRNLRLQLTHFRGRRAVTAVPTVMVPGPHPAAWERLCATLGVDPDLEAGARFTVAADGAPSLSGTIDSTIRTDAVTEYLVLVDGPIDGTAFFTAEGAGEEVACSAYLYAYGPEADDLVDRWSSWMRTALAR
jgi:uncharacterized protein YndB with AHSA1/START domain